MSNIQEKTWIVIADDSDIHGSIVFHVRNVSSELMARRAVEEEYKRQGWQGPNRLQAYYIPRFRGKQNIAQVCKVFAPETDEQHLQNNGMPIVEYA